MLLTYFDRRNFITLSVHLCLQHIGHDTARRAVPLRKLRLVFLCGSERQIKLVIRELVSKTFPSYRIVA